MQKEAGVQNALQQLTRASGISTLRYFAYDLDRGTISQIIAVLHANGQLTITHKTM